MHTFFVGANAFENSIAKKGFRMTIVLYRTIQSAFDF